MRTLGSAFKEIDEYFSANIEWIIRECATRHKEVPPLKSSDWLSMSQVPYMCPRAEAICLLDNYNRTDVVDATLRLIFENGNAFQDILRDIIAPSGVLYGMWRCKNCDYVHGSIDGEFTINDRGAKEAELLERINCPPTCGVEIPGYGKCECTEFEYIEETIIDNNNRIKGHPDGFIENRNHEDLLELKTINDYGYRQIKDAPRPEHVEQASWYAWRTNKKYILIIYFNKNGGAYRVHRLPVQDEIIDRIYKRVREIWRIVKEFEETGRIETLPEKTCDSIKNTKAKRCEVCERCFELDIEEIGSNLS